MFTNPRVEKKATLSYHTSVEKDRFEGSEAIESGEGMSLVSGTTENVLLNSRCSRENAMLETTLVHRLFSMQNHTMRRLPHLEAFGVFHTHAQMQQIRKYRAFPIGLWDWNEFGRSIIVGFRDRIPGGCFGKIGEFQSHKQIGGFGDR